MALSWTQDRLGPLCRTVEDCALVFHAIAKADEQDLSVIDLPFNWDADLDVRKLRVGYLAPAFEERTRNADWKRNDAQVLETIKALGVKAGVVLNPATPVVALEQIAGDVDFVLVMSVNPGFGGQSFIPRSEGKVREIRAALDRAGNASAPIEIDGGIDLTTAPLVVAAGARILVAGQAIFGTSDPERATRDLKARATQALAVAPAR
jgi:Asp-tRNA(Asn)/Glu-tRNA(Gln) amidotransferase A subunit family amidase